MSRATFQHTPPICPQCRSASTEVRKRKMRDGNFVFSGRRHICCHIWAIASPKVPEQLRFVFS